MSKFKIIFDGEEQDELFDTEEDAEEAALYLCSCTRTGAEILHPSYIYALYSTRGVSLRPL